MPDQSPKQLLFNFPTRPEFNFSNFVTSRGSSFAFDSAQNFCAPNNSQYHSLFIFGQKNLGKTHLLISIGNLDQSDLNKVSALFKKNLGDIDLLISNCLNEVSDYETIIILTSCGSLSRNELKDFSENLTLQSKNVYGLLLFKS